MYNGGARVIEGIGNIGAVASSPLGSVGIGSAPGLAQVPGVGGIQGIQGLGDATEGNPNTVLILGLSTLGSAISGAIIGGLSSSDWRGAGTGALATAGMSQLGLAVVPTSLGSARWAFAAIGLAAVGGSIWLAATRKGR